MAIETDGTRREQRIDLAAKAVERMNAARGQEPTTAADDADGEQQTDTQPQAQAAPDVTKRAAGDTRESNVIEVTVRGEVKTYDLNELGQTEEGRALLREKLGKGENYELLVGEYDSKVAKRAEERAIERDIHRGLLERDPVTQQLLETELGRNIREGRIAAPGRESNQQAEVPDGDFLTREERAKVRGLREQGLDGELDAFDEADRIIAAAQRRDALKAVTDTFDGRERQRRQEREIEQSHERTRGIVSTVNEEIGKHAIFATPSLQQAARNQVAAALEANKGVFDGRVLGVVAKLASELNGLVPSAPSPSKEPKQQKRPSEAPPSAAPGSSLPPGRPLPKGGAPAAAGDDGDQGRHRLGTSRMVDAVMQRLRG
ncbi:MAG TPA: hypothetical protein VM285_17035 [Polyangia bacterium]|nr:hypothetical protein [Polyangia bacterium]